MPWVRSVKGGGNPGNGSALDDEPVWSHGTRANPKRLARTRATAYQRRASFVAGHYRNHGSGGGYLPAGARWGARAWNPVMGVARRDEPRSLVTASGPHRRGHHLPPA